MSAVHEQFSCAASSGGVMGGTVGTEVDLGWLAQGRGPCLSWTLVQPQRLA